LIGFCGSFGVFCGNFPFFIASFSPPGPASSQKVGAEDSGLWQSVLPPPPFWDFESSPRCTRRRYHSRTTWFFFFPPRSFARAPTVTRFPYHRPLRWSCSLWTCFPPFVYFLEPNYHPPPGHGAATLRFGKTLFTRAQSTPLLLFAMNQRQGDLSLQLW